MLGGASRLAALLIAHLCPISSLFAPCDPGVALRQSVLLQRKQATSCGNALKARASNVAAVFSALLLLSRLVSAHHSFAAEFDAAKPVRLAGTFTKMEWTNPHAHIQLDVADPSGTVTSWRIELGTPNDLMRHGWSRTTVKSGDRIVVNGFAAKDGSRLATARSVATGDGRVLFARR